MLPVSGTGDVVDELRSLVIKLSIQNGVTFKETTSLSNT